MLYSMGTLPRSNWNLDMLVLRIWGSRSKTSEKNLSEQGREQTQPTYFIRFGNRTWATLVGGECCRHCAIPAHLGWLVSVVHTCFISLFSWEKVRYYLLEKDKPISTSKASETQTKVRTSSNIRR